MVFQKMELKCQEVFKMCKYRDFGSKVYTRYFWDNRLPTEKKRIFKLKTRFTKNYTIKSMNKILNLY